MEAFAAVCLAHDAGLDVFALDQYGVDEVAVDVDVHGEAVPEEIEVFTCFEGDGEGCVGCYFHVSGRGALGFGEGGVFVLCEVFIVDGDGGFEVWEERVGSHF